MVTFSKNSVFGNFSVSILLFNLIVLFPLFEPNGDCFFQFFRLPSFASQGWSRSHFPKIVFSVIFSASIVLLLYLIAFFPLITLNGDCSFPVFPSTLIRESRLVSVKFPKNCVFGGF